MIWLRKLQSKYEYIITIYIYTKIEQIKKHSKSLYTVPCYSYFDMSIRIELSLLIVIFPPPALFMLAKRASKSILLFVGLSIQVLLLSPGWVGLLMVDCPTLVDGVWPGLTIVLLLLKETPFCSERCCFDVTVEDAERFG